MFSSLSLSYSETKTEVFKKNSVRNKQTMREFERKINRFKLTIQCLKKKKKKTFRIVY